MAGGAAILGGNDYVYSDAHGGFINDKHRRIAEAINAFDPEVEVLWIPRDKRGPGDKAYALRHTPGHKPPYIFATYDEADFDERVLAEVFEMHEAANGPVSVAQRLDMQDQARRALELWDQMERLEEARDMALFLWNSPLHTINLGGGRKLHT